MSEVHNIFSTLRVVDEEWIENFQMSMKSFQALCDPLKKQTTHLRSPLSVEKQVAMFLHYISGEGRLRKTTNAFGTAKSTTSKVIQQVGTVISRTMSDLITLQTAEVEVKELRARFKEAHGFLQCIGAIDRTHINI